LENDFSTAGIPNPCAAGPIPAGGTSKVKGLWRIP
jgi:hypothetical protein